MKRLLSICLLVAIIVGSSSFTTNSGRNLKENSFKRYYVQLNQTFQLDNGPCTVTIHISIAFDWTYETGVSNVSYNAPTFTVNCPDGDGYAKTGDITTLTIDDPDAHVSDLAFSETGDHDIDAVISNSHNITILKSGLNSEIDFQKN